MPLDLEHAFDSLLRRTRQRVGLDPARLSPADGKAKSAAVDDLPGWTQIRSHAFFQALAADMGQPLPKAFVDYARAVARTLNAGDRLIVDRVCALRLDPAASYGGNLTERRRTLHRDWVKDFDDLERPASEQYIGESKLRNDLEKQALKRFVSALDAPTEQVLADLGVDSKSLPMEFVSSQPRPRGGAPSKVVVFGAAVMDVIFRIPTVPDADASVQASAFELHPGGKGLVQAVAAARLGLDTAIITAVGDDAWGTEIIRYLDSQNVDTTLVKVVEGEQTPVTGVITPDTGISFAIGWKNEANVSVTKRDLSAKERAAALRAADCLLVSFEPPLDAVEEAIASVHDAGKPVIVTPAPPPERRLMDTRVTRKIDYLVMNNWEASEFLRSGNTPPRGRGGHGRQAVQPAKAFTEIAQRLVIGGGVKHVLVPFEGQCHVFFKVDRGPMEQFQVPAWPTDVHESAGERDAFCAMLALQVINAKGRFARKAAFWATAAMAYAGGQLGVANSMPTYDDVAEIVNSNVIVVPAE